ncbi:calcineurin B-like protein 10 [Tanacetum coccineum]|uniref:Calcineurin B-like protein n=1 Tax=Tanacetum coccineum TaxID=301880 RepID=A0ABQ5G5S5_9ASTR
MIIKLRRLSNCFKSLSSSIIDYGLIHKEELRLEILFNIPHGENLFFDQVFDLFDEKRNGVIEVEECVHALIAFSLLDLREAGCIEREEVSQTDVLIAVLTKPEMNLSDDLLDVIIDKVRSL